MELDVIFKTAIFVGRPLTYCYICLEFPINGAFILCFCCIFLFLFAFTISLTLDNIFSSIVGLQIIFNCY